jgi:cobalt-zinc-cadmium efflux system protein
MAADAAVSLGVVLAGAAIKFTGWAWLDPVTSLAVVAVIMGGTWGLLRKSVNLAMDAVPEHIDPDEVRAYLAGLPGVTAVHDLHIWGMSTTEAALTCHLVRPQGSDDALLMRAAKELHDRFEIEHVTLQVEQGDPGQPCRLEPDHVV